MFCIIISYQLTFESRMVIVLHVSMVDTLQSHFMEKTLHITGNASLKSLDCQNVTY